MAPAKMEDQLTLVGRTLEEESSRKREEIEARHARELRELLRAQAKELKEFVISAQEKKETKLNDVKAKFQGEKVENTTIQQEEKVEKKGRGKINSCPACNEVPCYTNNAQRRPCECCDVVDNPSSLCDGCAAIGLAMLVMKDMSKAADYVRLTRAKVGLWGINNQASISNILPSIF